MVDSSLPVLVSRLPDRQALTRLVRAALRHEIAQVELTRGPQRAEAHTLDLHVVGQPPLALLAEPAGVPKNGQFPLRLRPLYRAQTAQLQALLDAEHAVDVSVTRPRSAQAAQAQAAQERHQDTLEDQKQTQRVDRTGSQKKAPESSPNSKDRDLGSEPSLSISVVFEADDAALAHRHALETISNHEADVSAAAAAEDAVPADTEEPSLSVSVVFEPDALPSGLLEDVPSPLGSSDFLDDEPPTSKTSSVTTTALAESSGASEFSPETTSSPDDADTHEGSFFDDVLANLPTVSFSDEAPTDPLLDNLPTKNGAPPEAGDRSGRRTADTFDGNGAIRAAQETFVDDVSGALDPPRIAPEAFVDDVSGAFEPLRIAPEALVDDVSGALSPRSTAATFVDEDSVSFDARPSTESIVDVADEEIELIAVPPQPEEGTFRARLDSDEDATLIRSPSTAETKSLSDTKELAIRAPAQDANVSSSRRDDDTALRPSEDANHRLRETPFSELESEADAEDETETRLRAVLPGLMTAEPSTPDLSDAPNSAVRYGHEHALGRHIADGKYVIETLIGSGAAGAVYRATHRELRRAVAIKLLHPHYQHDPHFMTSFRAEALAASQLDHPNVTRVLDFGQEPDGLVYIVMEFLSGRTLQSILDEERRLPTERAVEVMIQVCAALSVAHDHGIIHRDIKPDNIMLVPSRNDEGASFELVKVCDFGIAALQNLRAEDADFAAVGEVIAGTPEYMSPEQARGVDIDARSDVYSCGMCLYELVTGRPPFLGDHPAEILVKQLEEAPKPPSQIIKGLDPILEEVILRAVQKDPTKRHQSARELRVELKELIEPGDAFSNDDDDERSIVESVPVLDDPASGFAGFFIAFASAILRFGRFERGHEEAAQAMKELAKSLRVALRGRRELTFAKREVQGTLTFVVVTGTAEVVDLRRLLGSQLYGSFGVPFIHEVTNKGIVALTLREGISESELHCVVEFLLCETSGEALRKDVLSKSLRHVSFLFTDDLIGRERKLSWKVSLVASRLARDLRALCNVRGISLKKMREMRGELVSEVARLLSRGDDVKQFLFNADLIDEAVENLRGFSSFRVTPLIVEHLFHESCIEATSSLLEDFDDSASAEVTGGYERLRSLLRLFANRLVSERSPKSDAVVAELYRRKILADEDIPRDLKELIRAQTLADALVREPSQFLLTLDRIGNPETYAKELFTLEAAMATLARRSEALALLAVMSTLAKHAKGMGKPGPRENAALRTMKSMIDEQRLLPIANALLVGPAHQREAARQLILIAGLVGANALFAARETSSDPAARPAFVKIFRETRDAGRALLADRLPRMVIRNDATRALVEDLLHAVPEQPDAALGEAVAKYLTDPRLRAAALTALVRLWGTRAKKPLLEALEHGDDASRVVALNELRRLRAIDEPVVTLIERFLTTRGSASEQVRTAAAEALVDVDAPLRGRAVQLLAKVVEGKRGIVAMLRGNDLVDENVVVMEAMSRALLSLDRTEGIRAIKGRLARSEGTMKVRLRAVLQRA